MSNSKTFLQAVADTKPGCTEEDPELFFPNYNEGGEFQARRAKAVCRACPLVSACLEFALDTGDGYAILGGTTPAERSDIKRRMNDPYVNTPGLRIAA